MNCLFKDSQVIDLSYDIDPKTTIAWPGGEKLQLCVYSCMVPDPGNSTEYFYSAGILTCAEHTGTHIDAPFHFNQLGRTVDNLTLSQLVGPLKVIDISETVHKNITEKLPAYSLQEEDILRFESCHGTLQEGDIVLIRTGWHRFYAQGAKAYLGFDESIDGPYDTATSELDFPGISKIAAELLIQRKVIGVGLDTGTCML